MAIVENLILLNSLRYSGIIPVQLVRCQCVGTICRTYSTEPKHISVDDFVKKSTLLTKNFEDVTKIPKTESDNGVSKKTAEEPRFNNVNIQMIPEYLYHYLFGAENLDTKLDEKGLQDIHKELKKHGLMYKTDTPQKDVHLTLPPLCGNDLEEHFKVIGEQQSGPYRLLLKNLLEEYPEPPEKWELNSGWTCYPPSGEPYNVPYPLEDALVFDVEVCINAGEMPTIAVAMSSKAWYGWVSESLVDLVSGSVGDKRYTLEKLVPMESASSQRGGSVSLTAPRIVVGHNVSYDRARIKEQYWLQQTGTRFLDTMSMHICVSGITSYQRNLLKSDKEVDIDDESWRTFSSLNSLSEVHKLYCGETLEKQTRDLFVNGTLEEIRNQFDIVMAYCAGDVKATYNILRELFPLFLSRFPHPVTLAGMLELGSAYLPVNSNWNRYLQDSQQTFEDVDAETKILLANKANHACRLLHEEKYREDLWMWSEDWSLQELRLRKTSNKSKKITKPTEQEEKENSENHPKIESLKNSELLEDEEEIDEEYDRLKKKFEYLWETQHYLPAKPPRLPGYPAWYRKLCPVSDGITLGPEISASMQIAPKLLSLTWESYPLHYIREHGWGFLIPYSVSSDEDDDNDCSVPIKQIIEHCGLPKIFLNNDQPETEVDMSHLRQNVEDVISWQAFGRRPINDTVPSWYVGKGVWSNVNIENCCWFLKLPHKDGAGKNVGNPLAKDFINRFSENILESKDHSARKALENARLLSYWRNNCERICKQIVVWLEGKDLPKHLRKIDRDFGAILPQVVVCGTLTRRAVEKTWMTASNVYKDRIGSELRAMIQSPPGYHLVGADVDSQELWIASVLGDAHSTKIHGGTPFGWMTLNGSKSNSTDMHSITAKAIGISRDHAKVINYARIYGAGQYFAAKLLKQFNPTMSEVEAKNKATKMFKLTKGRKVYRIKRDCEDILETLDDKFYSMTEVLRLATKFGKSAEEIFDGPFWVGGTESAMFNRLEEIANCKSPVTPFLGGHLSRALEPKNIPDDKFLTTRVNWVVQSGAVDFLHLMLVNMRWLLHPSARFCLSFHDEVRYLVPSEYRYHAALALHITNLMTRAFCVQRLGLKDLPLSVAFFSSVEVDTALRKDSHLDCTTPSNPHGLSRGYNIPPGESVNIYQAADNVGGVLKAMSKVSKPLKSSSKVSKPLKASSKVSKPIKSI